MVDPADIANIITDVLLEAYEEIIFVILLIASEWVLVVILKELKINMIPLFMLIIAILEIAGYVKIKNG